MHVTRSLVKFLLYYSCCTSMVERTKQGPSWLPVVGNLLMFINLRKKLGFTHLVWSHLAATYGPVTGLRLGRDLIVVVTGQQHIKEVSIKEDFDGRPDGFFFRLRSYGERLGVAFVDGAYFHEQKRFILRHLKERGFGGSSMEQRILEDTEQLVEWLKNQSGPVSIQDMFDVSVLNNLWAMLAGNRFSLSDERLRLLLNLLRESFHRLDMSGGLLNQLPWLRHVAPQRSGYRQIVHMLNSILDFMQETVKEHQSTLKPGVIRDFIDAFLHEMDGKNLKNHSSFTEKQLLVLLMDMFMAGSETTSNTLAFAILFLLQHPDVHELAVKELDSVVEHGKLPSLRDRPRLTFIEAIILETQRLANVAPVAPPHRSKRKTTLNGYTIPKDTTILLSLYSAQMDVSYWGDPEVFRPQRFLDINGTIIHHDCFMPFGLGKRRCLGEALAKPSLFLFLATLLHCFTLSLAPEEQLPTTSAIDGATLTPLRFNCVLKLRS